jgi:hypothetical protein
VIFGRIKVVLAAVGIASGWDTDDGRLGHTGGVESAGAMIGFGLADGGEKLPANAAGWSLAR